mgnify:CR=1 FL=1
MGNLYLLIVPQGIETCIFGHPFCELELLIVPQGIETYLPKRLRNSKRRS